jgi:hypothetical protein
MKSLKSILIFLLVVVAIGASALAWKEYLELSELRTSTVSTDERADLQKRVWDSEKHVKELEQKLAASPAGQSGGAPNASAGSNNHGGADNGLAATMLSRMSDPEAQRLMSEQMRAQIEHRYAALFPKLNLPPDKLEQFKDLLVDRQQAPMDVLASANDQGISDPQDFQKMVQSTQADIDSQIMATIGNADYAQLQNFQQMQAVQGVVDRLNLTLSGTATPLTPAQAAQLTQVIAQTQPAPANGATATGNIPVRITSDTLAQAQGVLSAPQFQTLQEIQQLQQTQQRLRQIMYGGSNNGSGSSAGAKGGP